MPDTPKSEPAKRGWRDGLSEIIQSMLAGRGPGRLARFAVVGLVGVGVNEGSFWLFNDLAGMADLGALAIASILSIINNFVWNDIWTFRDKRAGTGRSVQVRGLKFAIVSAVAIGIYYAVYTPLTRILGMNEYVALAVAIGVGMVWNFSVNMLWTWRTAGKEGITPPDIS